MKPIHRYFLLFILLLVGAPAPLWAQSEPASAMISKVEGSGVAKVRRKSGVESVAGTKQELFSGDRVTTDANSVVEIILAEGTLVRVGLNSEYRLESVERKNGIMTWLFQLTKGSIRALVEKNPKKNMVKFRVNTPVGTMGVRGTELVLEHDQKAKRTTLYTVEGSVEFGAKNCVSRHACIEVKTGEMASVGEEGGSPVAQPASSAALLFPDGGAADTAKVDGAKTAMSLSPEQKNQLRSRIALFEDLNKAGSLSEDAQGIRVKDKGEIDKMVRDASEALADAQNDLIGRTNEEKEAIHRAIQDGTYEQRLKLAEKFDDIKSGKKTSAQERSEENLSASKIAKKMSLAGAILGSSKMIATLQKRTGLDESDLQDKVGAARQLLQTLKEQGPHAISAEEADNVNGTPSNAGPAVENGSAAITPPPAEAGAGKGGGAAEGSGPAMSPGNVMENAVDALDKNLVDGIIGDPKVETVYEKYEDLDKCGKSFIGKFFCDHDVKIDGDWYEIDKKINQKKMKTTIERKSGKCTSTVETCGRELIPCDLKKGKFCKATFKPYACKKKTKEVACPAP